MARERKKVRMTIEFDREQIRAIDRWRVELEEVPPRAKAIRMLLDKALKDPDDEPKH
jgi:hypothetical protein